MLECATRQDGLSVVARRRSVALQAKYRDSSTACFSTPESKLSGDTASHSARNDGQKGVARMSGLSPHLPVSCSGLRYCWRMTVSPWLRPERTSVRVPLEIPALMETLRRPFFWLGSGTSTEALRSLS